ncbi:hypothetical protein I7X12_15965 [Halosimplex litoreum]|uniref:Uncharacterized protein n=1 Tax=Halosimplex litoreum TaxID=1198301 RepID=A0A7T3FX23_9EURY|nr:hypothetical protein [Halosimplex litoreum]QPV62221.1 hypothetical protein I7X12_15965 [Halosimplex litoreum]
MTGLTDYMERVSDVLYAHTSDETARCEIYADAHCEAEHFSTRSTQSGASTYAAYEAENVEQMPGSVLPRVTDTRAREDLTGPPRPSTDD